MNNLNSVNLTIRNDNCNNSKGFFSKVKNKNMFLVNNNPLLFYTIDYAKKSQLIDKIYVSTG